MTNSVMFRRPFFRSWSAATNRGWPTRLPYLPRNRRPGRSECPPELPKRSSRGESAASRFSPKVLTDVANGIIRQVWQRQHARRIRQHSCSLPNDHLVAERERRRRLGLPGQHLPRKPTAVSQKGLRSERSTGQYHGPQTSRSHRLPVSPNSVFVDRPAMPFGNRKKIRGSF